MLLDYIPGFENAKAVYDKFKGQAKNPRFESAFKSIHLEIFNLNLLLHLKMRKKKIVVHKILQLFRFHMLLNNKVVQTVISMCASEFQITYMYRDNENSYLLE